MSIELLQTLIQYSLDSNIINVAAVVVVGVIKLKCEKTNYMFLLELIVDYGLNINSYYLPATTRRIYLSHETNINGNHRARALELL